MTRAETLSIAHTPNSDDVFRYYALQTGRLATPGYELEFHAHPIVELDARARERSFDITSISAAAYPDVARDYRILSAGTSVGRGYGPVLVSQHYFHPDQLQFRRVGVAGLGTTGGLLMKWACPDAALEEMPFDKIAASIAAGQLDAGVMIHEELLHYPRHGLHKVVDLGGLWHERTRLPLPLELNVVSRRFSDADAAGLCQLVRESLLVALGHRDEALAWAARHGRAEKAGCESQHVAMFANADSAELAEDVRMALELLLPLAQELGISNAALPEIDIVDASRLATHGVLAA